MRSYDPMSHVTYDPMSPTYGILDKFSAILSKFLTY